MRKTSGKRQKLPIIICLVMTVLIGCLLCSCAGQTQIADNVTVAGVAVGGMSKREAMSAVRDAIGDSYETTDMTVQVEDQSIVLTPEAVGISFDASAAVALALDAKVGEAVDLTDCLNLNTDAIATALKELMANFGTELSQPSYIISGVDGMDKTLILNMGTPGYGLTYDSVYAQVLSAYSNHSFSLTLSGEIEAPDAVDLDAIYEETYIAPVNAVYDTEKKETTDHILGYSIDVEAAKELVKNASYGENVSIPYVCIEPEITKTDLDGMLFRDVLSTYTAKSGSISSRDVNLRIACETVNGVVLQPGEVFDYNKTLGERTEAKGYKYGASYIGNKTINTIGGGICQVSSTIYYCALMADMEIVTRTNHGFLNTYVPMGMDATVSWGGPEFRFKNNSDYPIRIEASASAGHTTVTIYGTDTKDYYVKMEYNVLATYPWESVVQELPPDNPDGYKDGQVISTAYTGYKIATYRCKYDKATNELISRVQETLDTYNKRDYVVCKIVDPNATEPSAPSEPSEPTDPPVETEPSTPPVEPVIPDGPVTEDG